MECYAAAAKLMEQACSQNELIQNGDYIRLLVLAGSPTAEKARKEHLAYIKAAEANGHEMRHIMETEAKDREMRHIKEFDRSKIKPLIDAILAAQRNSRDNE